MFKYQFFMPNILAMVCDIYIGKIYYLIYMGNNNRGVDNKEIKNFLDSMYSYTILQ